MGKQFDEASQFLRARTLVECLQNAAAGSGTISFVETDLSHVAWKWGELRERALKRLALMRAAGVMPGASVLLIVKSLPQWVEGFWAAVSGGFLVVPLAPPSGEEDVERIVRILGEHDSPWLLTDIDNLPSSILKCVEGRVLSARALSPEEDQSVAPAEPVNPRPEDLALLQYSSGSTSAPKGVMVTHANLIVNLHACIERFGAENFARTLSWLPLTHDFGLILLHMAPLAIGADNRLIPTGVFMKDPLLYLDEATDMHATFMATSNAILARMLADATPERAAKWDLSSIRCYPNGAE